MTTWLERIVISNNGADLSGLTTNAIWWDGSNIVLYILPNNYKTTNTNSSFNLGVTGTGTYLSISRIQKKLEITAVYKEIELVTAIYRIAKKALDDRTPLTLRDYLYPEDADFSSSYTDRTGFIQLPITKSTLVKDPITNNRYLTEGFSFMFEEDVIRDY